MIVVRIDKPQFMHGAARKRFDCPHCGKMAQYYTMMETVCTGKECLKPLLNIDALLRMPSAKISWHKGTNDLLCSP